MSAAAPHLPEGASPAWPRVAQWALAFLLGLITTLVLGRFFPIFDRSHPTTLERPALASGVDLNQAGKPELTQLPKVSDKRADAILATRDRSGGFNSPDDLRAVKGIG